MSIKLRLDGDMKQAMREKDSRRLTCIRMLKSKILEREVALRAKEGRDYSIGDDEAERVIAGYAKQRRDSIESYEKAGRPELVAAEREELEVVRGYLPEQLGEEAIRAAVREAIAESGASSVKDMGAVMKCVMPKLRGAADGRLVGDIVRELLA